MTDRIWTEDIGVDTNVADTNCHICYGQRAGSPRKYPVVPVMSGDKTSNARAVGKESNDFKTDQTGMSSVSPELGLQT